jgi:hypothetical protein
MGGFRRAVFAQLIGIGQDILTTLVDKVTGTISAQLGDATNGIPDIDAAEWVQHVGFWSRPADPTPNAPVNGAVSAQCVTIKNGDRDVVVASRDLRSNSVYGNIKAGETCVGATAGQARVYCKANGAVVLYTTANNESSGTSVMAYVGPDQIQLANSFGAITIDSTGITITAGQAALVLTAAGDAKLMGQTATVNGSIAAISGTSLTTVGPMPAVPATPALYGLSGIAGLPSTNVFISV